MLFADALSLFVAQLRADGRSPNTVIQYRRNVALFANWALPIGIPDDVREIDHIVVARFLGSPTALLKPDGGERKVTTVNATKASLRVFFRYLFDVDVLARDPGRLIKLTRCGKAPPRGMAEGEVRALLSTIAEREGELAKRDHALFTLLRSTGMRVGSAVAIDVEDLDLDEGLIDVRVAKGRQQQLIRADGEMVSRLKQYLGERIEGPLFPRRDGGRLSTRHVGRRFRLWSQKARIKRHVTAHGLRHAFAHELYRQTRDIFAVQRALGHASIMSTVRYAGGFRRP